MCVAGALRLRQMDVARSILIRNVHDPAVRAMLPERLAGQMLRSMIARMPDGSWRIGYFAWCEILSAVLPLSMLGRVMKWPVFYGIGPAVYNWIAEHRLIISRLLRLPPPCDPNGVCRLDAAQDIMAAQQTLFGKS